MTTERKDNNNDAVYVIRMARFDDIDQIRTLYQEQYSADLQQKHKSISKYIKRTLKTDLKDINKYYLTHSRRGLWVVYHIENPDVIVGMVGVQEDYSNKKFAQKSKANMTLARTDDKPDFVLAYKLIDDVIDLLMNGLGDKTTESMNDTAEIRRFVVSNSHRRRGIGSLLLEHVMEFCLNHEYKRLTASTMSVLKEAIEFYKGKGFELVQSDQCRSDSDLMLLRFSSMI